MKILITYDTESMKCRIAPAPSLHLLAEFAMYSDLSVLLCQLASTEEESSRKYGCTWHKHKTLHKHSGRWGWRNYWCSLRLSSCCSHRRVLLGTRAQSENICRKAAWSKVKVLSGLQACLNCPASKAKYFS